MDAVTVKVIIEKSRDEGSLMKQDTIERKKKYFFNFNLCQKCFHCQKCLFKNFNDFGYRKIKQALAFAIVVGKVLVVEVPVDVDHAHALEPSGVGISVIIQIQDGGPD